MRSDADNLKLLIKGMRNAYFRGENAMEYARSQLGALNGNYSNDIIATLIAYDLQSGSYIANVKKNHHFYENWSRQLANILDPLIEPYSSICEVGCGEATTMSGILSHLKNRPDIVFGFDLSWSRINCGNEYLRDNEQKAKLFVADMFSIPFMSNSIDIVYSSHSLEPNGGKEREAIAELLRISRKWVVLVEPIYELASEEARKRMDSHGYVKDLRRAAEICGAKVIDQYLLEHISNSLNPSGLLLLEKQIKNAANSTQWACPITGNRLIDDGDIFISENTGLIYPVIRGIPMLRAEHAIVASGATKEVLTREG